MDDGWSSLAINWFNGEPLAIRPHQPLNAEWSVRLGIHLGEVPVPLQDKLARLEVEQERGCLPLVLVTAGERAHKPLALMHP